MCVRGLWWRCWAKGNRWCHIDGLFLSLLAPAIRSAAQETATRLCEMLMLDLLTDYKSLHHCQADLYILTELQWIIEWLHSEQGGSRPQRPRVGFFFSQIWRWLCVLKAPILSAHAWLLFVSLCEWGSASGNKDAQTAHTMSSLFTIMLFPSSQQPAFICSVVNSLAVKLRDWLWCLSGFYLLPWFIFIPTMKGSTERHPVLLFSPRQDDLASQPQHVSSHVSHTIVYQRRCNITVLREMIALEFYGLL